MNTIQPGDLEKYRALPWSFAHVALNNFFYTWTFGGSVFLLFLSQLGLPKDQIGILLSLFPFAGLLALLPDRWWRAGGAKRCFYWASASASPSWLPCCCCPGCWQTPATAWR